MSTKHSRRVFMIINSIKLQHQKPTINIQWQPS